MNLIIRREAGVTFVGDGRIAVTLGTLTHPDQTGFQLDMLQHPSPYQASFPLWLGLCAAGGEEQCATHVPDLRRHMGLSWAEDFSIHRSYVRPVLRSELRHGPWVNSRT